MCNTGYYLIFRNILETKNLLDKTYKADNKHLHIGYSLEFFVQTDRDNSHTVTCHTNCHGQAQVDGYVVLCILAYLISLDIQHCIYCI